MYIAVTPDDEELPIATADTEEEMARLLHSSKWHVSRCVNGKRGFGKRSKFRVYRINDEEDEL